MNVQLMIAVATVFLMISALGIAVRRMWVEMLRSMKFLGDVMLEQSKRIDTIELGEEAGAPEHEKPPHAMFMPTPEEYGGPSGIVSPGPAPIPGHVLAEAESIKHLLRKSAPEPARGPMNAFDEKTGRTAQPRQGTLPASAYSKGCRVKFLRFEKEFGTVISVEGGRVWVHSDTYDAIEDFGPEEIDLVRPDSPS